MLTLLIPQVIFLHGLGDTGYVIAPYSKCINIIEPIRGVTHTHTFRLAFSSDAAHASSILCVQCRREKGVGRGHGGGGGGGGGLIEGCRRNHSCCVYVYISTLTVYTYIVIFISVIIHVVCQNYAL